MNAAAPFVIKSFKYDGHLHRMWHENWRVPQDCLHPEHADESMLVLINSHTRIQEANGEEWISKIPAVSFFIPQEWYNIVALLEDAGIRYYCNIASPMSVYGQVITYIDYDLDVIRDPRGHTDIVDQEEYAAHKVLYRYPHIVKTRIDQGLNRLLARIERSAAPFQDDIVLSYYKKSPIGDIFGDKRS